MKTATTTLINFLNASQEMVVADLWTFRVQRSRWQDEVGVVFSTADYRYTSIDRSVVYGGNTYAADSLIIERDRVRSVVGLEVDKMAIKVHADATMLMEGLPFIQACIKGVLDGAVVTLDRAYFNKAMALQGVVNMFNGRASTGKIGRTTVELEIASDLELLNINMPRNTYQPGCLHSVYDTGCGLNMSRAAFSYEGEVTSGTAASITAALTNEAGFWDLGGLIFKTGSLTGVLRTIKHWDGTAVTLMNPLPFAPDVGDIFQVYAGCDNTRTMCSSKFNNLANFKGFPLVPVPETMR